jgi:hypothetical protein
VKNEQLENTYREPIPIDIFFAKNEQLENTYWEPVPIDIFFAKNEQLENTYRDSEGLSAILLGRCSAKYFLS